MGVKSLNSFLFQNVSKNAISRINLHQLAGKTLAIDVHMLIYKFKSEHNLIRGMIQYIQYWHRIGAKLIFIFDPKPPPEKQAILNERHNLKLHAENKCREITELLSSSPPNDFKLTKQLEFWTKQTTRISKNEIQQTKDIITACGASYITSTVEADYLCVHLVKEGIADICISEDTDMFPLGCPTVLRLVNISKNVGVLYNIQEILNELDITQEHLQLACSMTNNEKSFEKALNEIRDGADVNKIDMYELPDTVNNYEIIHSELNIGKINQLLNIATAEKHNRHR